MPFEARCCNASLLVTRRHLEPFRGRHFAPFRCTVATVHQARARAMTACMHMAGPTFKLIADTKLLRDRTSMLLVHSVAQARDTAAPLAICVDNVYDRGALLQSFSP
eukprot:scaffold212635_cov37-Tisochrysis_lutea.AAC.4